MKRFTVATIAELTSRATSTHLEGWWLARGPMPGESVGEVLARLGAEGGDLLELLRAADQVPEGVCGLSADWSEVGHWPPKSVTNNGYPQTGPNALDR